MKKSEAINESDIYFTIDGLDFLVRICTATTKRHRRTVLLTMFRALKPVFRELRESGYRVWHWDSRYSRQFQNVLERKPSLGQAPQLGSDGEKLGYQIRMLRLDSGLTQSELARRIGVSATYVSELERGRHSPRAKTLESIATALDEAAREIRDRRSATRNRRSATRNRRSAAARGFDLKSNNGTRVPTDTTPKPFDLKSKFTRPGAPPLRPAITHQMIEEFDSEHPPKLILKRH